MKAVFQNTMFSLLCLASVVLAAPHQSISVVKQFQNMHNPAKCQLRPEEEPCATTCKTKPVSPSIEEGTVRFACF